MDVRDIVYVTEEETRDIVVRRRTRDMLILLLRTAEESVHAII